MYGLIGKKLGHSFSADFFNKKFAEEMIPESYELFPLPSISDLPKLIYDYPDLKGFNVTIPYKQEIIPFLGYISSEAKEIGAINVVKIKRDRDDFSYLEGYNTDCIGFRESLVPLLKTEIKSALVLGTGGASKAVIYVLRNLDINYTLVSRRTSPGFLTYPEITENIISQNLLIINTTPLGMAPEIGTCPPIPYQFLTPAHICYDLVYNPSETLFLKKAFERGALIKNGLEMLHLQALASWDIWNA